MRTFAIVLATAVITSLLTSAVWMFLLRVTYAPRPAPSISNTIPAMPKPSIRKPVPAQSPPSVAAPNPGMPRAPITARIGVIPDDLAAKHLTIPVPGVRPEDLRPAFYDARGERGHEAIDIMAARGQRVIAAEDGTIAKLFTSVRGGLTIYEFDPSEKYAYYYAHLDHYADGLAQGAKVTRGQTIGYVGSTGDADPAAPHLHFAIFQLGPEKQWWKGEALDPYPALMPH